MIRSRTALPLSALLLLGLGILTSGAGAAPPRPIAPRPAALQLEPFYLQRENTASAPIKAQLIQERQAIQAAGHKYTIGYTTALDHKLEEITGLKVPPDIATQVTRHWPVQQTLLQKERSRFERIIKTRPQIAVPADFVPPFNASSPQADWRSVGRVTPIKDQKHCGSCWAFAVMGAYESSHLIRNNQTVDTAEQVLVSCSNGGNCAGGWTATALAWLLGNGSSKEPDYPYTATNSACHTHSADYHSAAWGYVRPDGTVASTAELKQAIVDHGPVVVALYATWRFQAYAGGVFYESIGGGALNHAVVLVGWDDSKGAWIMRNSWGTGWGEIAGYGTERGYMYLAYGSSDVGIWSQWVQAQKLIPAP